VRYSEGAYVTFAVGTAPPKYYTGIIKEYFHGCDDMPNLYRILSDSGVLTIAYEEKIVGYATPQRDCNFWEDVCSCYDGASDEAYPEQCGIHGEEYRNER